MQFPLTGLINRNESHVTRTADDYGRALLGSVALLLMERQHDLSFELFTFIDAHQAVVFKSTSGNKKDNGLKKTFTV